MEAPASGHRGVASSHKWPLLHTLYALLPLLFLRKRKSPTNCLKQYSRDDSSRRDQIQATGISIPLIRPTGELLPHPALRNGCHSKIPLPRYILILLLPHATAYPVIMVTDWRLVLCNRLRSSIPSLRPCRYFHQGDYRTD